MIKYALLTLPMMMPLTKTAVTFSFNTPYAHAATVDNDYQGYLKDYNKARIVFNLVSKPRDANTPELKERQQQELSRECALETLALFDTPELMTNRAKVSRILLVICNKKFTNYGYHVQSINIRDIRTAR